MTYLLDSSVISELASANPNPAVVRWLDAQPEETVYISVISLAEIAEKVASEASSARKALLSNWLTNDLMVRFSGRVSEITAEVGLIWGETITSLKSLGRVFSVADSLYLAIALAFGHTLVTRNVARFVNTGVKLFDPFDFNK